MQAHRDMGSYVKGDLTNARARLRVFKPGSEASLGDQLEASIEIFLAIGQAQEFINLLLGYLDEVEMDVLTAQEKLAATEDERNRLLEKNEELEGRLAEATHKLDQMREKYEPF